MSTPKVQSLYQTHIVGRSHSSATSRATVTDEAVLSPEDQQRDLTRHLNRRGAKLRVKRRRGDTNISYSEKQLTALTQRLAHAREHLAIRQADFLEGQRLLALAREIESERRNNQRRS